MAPPTNQKYLVQVDRSEMKTIKFKNGFPPKMIRSRNSFEDFSQTVPHQRIQLMECEPQLKSNTSNPLMRTTPSFYKDSPQPKPAAEAVSNESRNGFTPSSLKQGSPNHQRPLKAPFSPPPTMSELRSLTKKIGRFYTKNNDTHRAAVSPVYNQQKAIMDIEKALSEKDVQGLENCYKRIFNGNVDPIRTMVRNQSYPNQRSRQASCPVAMHGTTNSTRSSPVWSNNIARDTPRQRRWSTDNGTERLPIVPAPYFRNESSQRSRLAKVSGEGPVMYSSARHDYREKLSTPPTNTVMLNLDPERFPEPSLRSPHFERRNQSGSTGRNSKSPKITKPIVYKSSSQWNQRAPNSTPEPHLRNEMLIGSGQHKDLLPQVVPAQLRYNTDQRSATSEQINCKAQRKLSKNRFDTREANTEPQFSEASSNRREITEDVLTERKRVLTSGGDSDTDCDYNERNTYDSVSNKSVEGRDLSLREGSSISSGVIKEKDVKVLDDTKRKRPDEEASSRNADEIVDPAVKSSMVENIDLQKLEINSIHSSCSETEENIVDVKSAQFKDPSFVDSRKSSAERRSTREIEMNERKASHMESVNIVVVNVTTDEGEDVNADIYEYEKGKEPEQFEVAMESPEESNKENGQPTTRNRKEELETLLKEHSSIVEEVKNLSESVDV